LGAAGLREHAGGVLPAGGGEEDEVSQGKACDHGEEVADIEGHDCQHEEIGGGQIHGVEDAQQESDNYGAVYPAGQGCWVFGPEWKIKCL
jgi:hypothetical protein